MKWLFAGLFCLWAAIAQAQQPLGPFGCMTGTGVSSCTLKTAGGQLFDFQVTNLGGTALWVFLVDSATAPVNGTVVGVKYYALPAVASTTGVSWIPNFLLFFTGITIACSTTAPPTLTLTTTCLISGETL